MYETSYSHAIVPHKLYYYLALRKPILAIAQRDGEAARITEAAEAGVVASSKEPARITEAIARWSRELKITGRLAYQGREEEIAKYSADRRAQLLADAVRRLSGVAPACEAVERRQAVS
jgi:hypothetical protein